jgi:hypothetical protein
LHHKNVFLFILITTLCAGCGGNIGNPFTATPDFVTATLSSTLAQQAPQATRTSTPPALIPSAVEETNISSVEGTTTTQVNVRAEPSTASKSLGMIGPFVKIQVIGRETIGSWYQVIYAESETGKGWVASKFLQVGNVEAVPIIGAPVDKTAIQTAISTPNAVVMSAMQDGDSMQVPLAVAMFSATGSRALQVNGEVSAPTGDTEDWIQFTTADEMVTIDVTCQGNALRVELWKNEKPVDNLLLSCGNKAYVAVVSNSKYFLRLLESSANEPGYTSYKLSLESIR